MSTAAGEAIFRLDRMIDEMVELRKVLTDIENPDHPPRHRPPPQAPLPEGMPAPTTYGMTEDRAATKDDLRLLRAVAKGKQINETDLDAIVMRRTRKPRWNMLSKRECQETRLAIEAGER